MSKKIYLLFTVFVIASFQTHSQGLLCELSEPFCTGSIYTFPAGTTGNAQPGANYGCLSTQPAPAWYHMLIGDPGNINIYMFSTPLVDIDFICWGPFLDPYSPCVAGLTSNKIVSCSYSPNPTENCYIPNGQTGEYYILLITNYSRQPCDITFSQTSGSGSTDCTILPPPVSNNGPLCVGQNLQLSAADVNNATYAWIGPAGFISNLQNPVIISVTLANAGDYSCIITVNGQNSDPAITSVQINELPTLALLSDDITICPGSTTPISVLLGGAGPFEVDYTDGTNVYTASNLWGPVAAINVSPTAPTTYTLTQVRDIHCLRNLLFVDININTYPQTSASITGNASICAGESTQLIFNLTGSPPWLITYLENGGNPQNIGANTSPHTITVYPSVTTNYSLETVTDLYCSGQVFGSADVTVFPSPTSNAGNDQTIPYGTITTLSGQASGGSGNYQYAWSPADKLVNPNIAQPTTINLTETTLFALTVTDNNGGCYDSDDAYVNISGGPLGCSPTANPSVICHNLTTQLYSNPNGGSGEYTYSWSSVPSGFNSSLRDPVVQPDQTTTYYVAVDDGYYVSNGSIIVTVNPRPVPDAGTNQTIPHGTSTQLSGSGSGGTGNYSYAWTAAETLEDPYADNPHTVNVYASTLFSLSLTDLTTGCSSQATDQVMITVSGDALSAFPVADPDVICHGESTRLFAGAGGGSGQYGYIWTSVPPGFSSTDIDPVVSPLQTTLYTVSVNDGFNTTSGSVTISVLESPQINLGPQNMTVCVYDTVILDAGNPGSSYLWTNGSTERTISIATTGIGFDMQTLEVTVTNPSGCQATGSATIVFDFAACTGIGDEISNNRIRIYPNPGDGSFKIIFDNPPVKADVVITNILGQVVFGPALFQDFYDQGEIRIDLNSYPKGIYFIHIHSDDNSLQSVKYILNQ